MSTRQKTKNRANLYNDSTGYSDMSSYNPRSQTTMSHGHYNAPRDSRVVADKVKRIPIHIDEILRTEALNDADPVRYWKTQNAFRPYSVYLDLSHCNAMNDTTNGVYVYDFTQSKLRGINADKAVITSGVVQLESGDLKIPLYLAGPGMYYDLSEIYVQFTNLPVTYNNGKYPYHFKYYPTQQLQVSDTTKLLMLPENKLFFMTNPHQLDTFNMVLRDKGGNIIIPYPVLSGIILTGSPTVINSPNHGLQTGYYVTRIDVENVNTPTILTRYYPITVIDDDNFSVPVDTSGVQYTYIDGKPVKYLVDNYNFELNIKAININWDEEHTFGGRK